VVIVAVGSKGIGNLREIAKQQAATAILPTLVGSADYSILGGAAITNTGSTSTTGAVGVSPGTSIGGGITAGGGTHSNDVSATAAQTDATNLYTSLNNQTCDFSPVGPTDLAGATLVPGVYCYSSSVQISVGGVLTLDAQGDPNAVWIFKTGSTLTTVSGASVVFLGGIGQPCNVFWQIGSSATLGTTTTFVGTIVAADDITLLTGTTVNGRILARGVSSDGTVVLDTNTISGPTGPTCSPPPAPTCTLSASPTTVVSGSPSTLTWTTANATTLNIDNGIGSVALSGTQSVSPTTTTTYTGTVDGGATCTATVATTTSPPPAPTCTLSAPTPINSGSPAIVSWITTNADTFSIDNAIGAVTPVIAGSTTTTALTTNTTFTGTVVNSSGHATCTTIVIVNHPGGGGSYTPPPVPPLIDLVKVPSPLALPSGPGSVIYTYTLRNIGKIPVTNVTLVDDTCSPIVFVSGDTNADKKLDVNETWTYDCFKTLSATHTNVATATGWANGISATDVANATVVVGAPVVPPLIHVTKIPNPLVLLSGVGMVTYTEKITNPGTVALSNVHLTDNKCGPMNYISGDTNNDSKLDPTETWTYTCQTKLLTTTTNTATASGDANGMTAKDFAIVTVVVSSPGLPKTGFPPEEKSAPWNYLLNFFENLWNLNFH